MTNEDIHDAIVPPEFVRFPSIARISRECVVTEKIDGTNACIHVAEDGSVFAGSRSRWLTKGQDNFGFGAWVKAHEDELRGLGIGTHHGEWWGSGIQRRYGLVGSDKRFSLFNTAAWSNNRDVIKYPTPRPTCCSVVPVLYSGPFATPEIDGWLLNLEVEGSRAAPGFTDPEGIVIWHEAARVLLKKTLGNDGRRK